MLSLVILIRKLHSYFMSQHNFSIFTVKKQEFQTKTLDRLFRLRASLDHEGSGDAASPTTRLRRAVPPPQKGRARALCVCRWVLFSLIDLFCFAGIRQESFGFCCAQREIIA